MTDVFDIVITEQATRDYYALIDYVKREAGVSVARTLKLRLDQTVRSLTWLPLRYQVYKPIPSIRLAPCSSWTIFYRITARVEVIRILHQSRDVTREMLGQDYIF